jgi:hypothetical protein
MSGVGLERAERYDFDASFRPHSLLDEAVMTSTGPLRYHSDRRLD